MTASSIRHWPDIRQGESFTTDQITVSRRDILEFAAEFDPQPYHLDAEAANASIFGGLCASGWHVTALMMRLLTDTFNAQRIDLLGSSGVSSLRWRKPVFAGDTLSAAITVTGHNPPAPGSAFGFIDCDVEVDNQQGERVIVLNTSLMIGRGQEVAHG